MDAVPIVVLEVILENSTQMSFAEDNDPIQAFAANAAVESFRVCVLPRAAVRCDHLFDAQVLYSSFEIASEYCVSISK